MLLPVLVSRSAQRRSDAARRFAGLRLAPAPRTEIVADDRGPQPVQIGHHYSALDAAGDLIDEPGQARIAAEPEDRHLRSQPGHIVEALYRVGDRPRVRGVVKEYRCAFAVDVLEVRRRLTVGDDEHDRLRVGVT